MWTMVSPAIDVRFGMLHAGSNIYAIGMHDPGAQPAMFEHGEPLGTIECVSLFAPWLDHGDGFTIRRAGRVIALGASNAMKFGPLLGRRLVANTFGQ